MFALCLGIVLFLIIVGVFLDLEFIDKSSNAKTPDDISIVGLISSIVAIALIAPVAWGGMIGFVEIAIEFFKSK